MRYRCIDPPVPRPGYRAFAFHRDAVPVRRRAAIVLAILFVLALLAGVGLSGQTRAVGASSVLAVLSGGVELAHDAAAYAPAGDGEVVVSGDRVRTDELGHAVVTFFDGSTLDIAPATEVTVLVAVSRDGAVDLVIGQAIGRTFSSVHKLVDPRSRYEIRTPSLTAAVRGTKFEIEVAADGSASERTTEGLVAVRSAGSEVLVPAGTETRATPGMPPTPPTPTLTSAPSNVPLTAPAQRPAVTVAPGASPILEPTTAAPGISAPPSLGSSAPAAPALSGPLLTAIPTLTPLPVATLAPLATATLLPLSTPTLAPLPTSLVPLPTASLAPLPSPTLSPLGTALPLITIP